MSTAAISPKRGAREMPTPIRFRRDSLYDALDGQLPKPEPGDCWRIGVYGNPNGTAGYAICCPRCREVHFWTHAVNCKTRRSLPDGGSTCGHERTGTSCWTWQTRWKGVPVNARPSLHCDAKLGGCGYHGFLRNGALTDG